jgi:thiol-disulfide isomerase/thioredoxin
MNLDDPRVRAPELPPSVWLNTYSEVSLRSLQPSIVLVDFWDYTCINCRRTMPYLRAWYERYQDLGFEIVGVHTPEFRFARQAEHVKSAIGRLGMRWPVILDNDQIIWTSFANRYWPTIYLIDGHGYIRFRHAGEGGYTQIETAIQTLLRESKSDLELPPLMPMFKAEDAPGAVCIPTTQELHIDALVDPLPGDDIPGEFSLPCDLVDGHFYLEGFWRLNDDGLTLSSESGTITLPCHAADIYAVLSPHPQNDTDICFDHDPRKIEVLQDGQPLPDDHFGQDIYKVNERSLLRVDAPRSYHLAHYPTVHHHQLQLRICNSGLTFFAFSFGSCITTKTDENSDH